MRRFISILLLTGLLTSTACTPLYQLYNLSGCIPTDHGENHKRQNVILLHKNGDVYPGEIYAVHESSIVFCTKEKIVNATSTPEGFIQVIDFDNIDGVMRKGESRVFLGALIGFILAKGYFWYEENEESKRSKEGLSPCGGEVGPYDYIVNIILPLGGAVIGGVIGFIYPESGKKIEPDSEEVLKELRFLARYPYKEPEWLEKFVQNNSTSGGISG